MKTSLKDWRKVYRRIRDAHGFDEHEKVLFARSLAATPDERWQMNVTYLKSLGLWGRSGLRRSASELDRICRSKEAIRRPKDLIHVEQINRLLRLKRSRGRW